MKQALNLEGKEVYISSNIMIIEKEDFAHYTILNL